VHEGTLPSSPTILISPGRCDNISEPIPPHCALPPRPIRLTVPFHQGDPGCILATLIHICPLRTTLPDLQASTYAHIKLYDEARAYLDALLPQVRREWGHGVNCEVCEGVLGDLLHRCRF
jgi:hypothetical protein